MRLGRIARISLILLAFAAAPAAAQTAPSCGGLPATIVGTDGNDQLRGTAGNDVIAGLGGNDVIRGEGGHDVICGGPGNDTLFGGPGNDRLIGGDGNDSIHAGEGDDFLDGAGGKNNTLHGDEGWDQCVNGKPHKCEDDGSTQNTAPVAHAGADQTTPVNTTVTLDGTGSTDADGDTITYSWTLTARPAGSTAVLSDPAATRPTLVIDRPGTYVAELTVSDGSLESDPDSVQIATTNSPPVAHAGAGQTARVGDTVTLNGSQSSDVDGDPITYRWTLLSAPDGSSATLAGATTVTPSFVIDRPGAYVAELIVNDGLADSEADTVTVVTTNSPPVANAGADQSAPVTATVTLDGSGSTDVDGDALTYLWSLTSVPAGSLAALSDTTAVAPAFTIDLPGVYVAQLVVNDGTSSSAADTVAVSTSNSAPVANAGEDQSGVVGAVVTLDGNGSSDIDGDPLTFRWSLISVPDGSLAALTDTAAVNPSFTIDRPGNYVAQLVVSDGSVDSAPDTVTVTTANSAPIADAGPDGSAHLHELITLDGSASRDADFNPLTYRWSFTSRPPGSTAALLDDTTPAPSFTPDAHGMFIAQLIVNDGTVDSAPDTITITTLNRPPTADAGPAQTVDAFDTVTLSGSGADADGDTVTLHWTLETVPAGSTAVLADPSAANPTFVADRAGTYVARLVANDGQADSDPAFVTIDARPPQLQLVVVNNALLGVGRSTQVQVVLPRPAPADATVTITSDPASAVTIAPGSVLIPAGASSAQVTVTGVTPGPALLTGSAPDYRDGTVGLTVTDKLVTLDDGFTVPLGQQGGITVSISPLPAPPGGTVIQLTTSDENVIAVSASVTILPGQFSAVAIVTGVRPGTAIVTATNPDFATDTASVSTSAALNITAGAITFAGGFTGNITVQLTSGGAPVPAPSPGVPLTLTSANPECAVAQTPSPNLATGLSQLTTPIAYGGTATLPCTTTVTASSPGVTSDSVTVTVNPKPVITLTADLPTTIGSGQMSANLRAFLAIGGHGGATVTISSNNPNVLVSPNAGTVGTPSIVVNVPNNSTQVNFIAHALEGFTGSATITASEPRFTSTTGTVNVVQPALQLNGLANGITIDTLDPNRGFSLIYGIPNVNGVSSRQVRVGGTPVTVTVTSGTSSVADLVSGGTTAASVTTTIAVGSHVSPNLEFHPKVAGQTTVTIAAPGVITTPLGSALMTVTTPIISLTPDLPQTIGSGQMTVSLRAFLSASAHGGAPITISSNNPNVLVSPNTSTVGAPSIVITVPNNQAQANFVVHALEGFVGSATITASEPRFTSATGTVTVVQPAIMLNGLAGTTIDSLDPNRPFTVIYGIPAGAGVSSRNIRAGGVTVNITVTSSNPAVADLVIGSTTAASITAPITAGSLVTGTLMFHPISAGQTTVTIAAPGVITTPQGTATMTVTTPTISLSPDLPQTIGSGQMTVSLRAFLSASLHGGAPITISSNNPNVLVSPNTGTPGTPSIVITVPNNQAQANFVVHALEGFVGSATITASEPRFTSGTGSVTVVQPAMILNGLANGITIDTLDPNRAFTVLYGIPSGNSVSSRNIRAGGATVNVTVTSSNPAVADLVSGGTTAATVTTSIAAGNNQSPNLQFHPIAAGQTTVSIAAAGVITQPLGTALMTVTTPIVSLASALPVTVGAGLQSGTRQIVLGASNHGGAVVRIESSNPAIALVSPNTTTAGSAFILVTVPNNQTIANFVVQGVEGADGNVVITASTPRFSDGQGTARVVPAAVQLQGVNPTATAGGADDPFMVLVGIPNADGSALAETQPVRGGGQMMITVTSSAPAVAGFVSGGTTVGNLTVPIGPNQAQTANIPLRPLSAGTATIAVTGPGGVITTGLGVVNVTVNP